jgi:NTE family protein
MGIRTLVAFVFLSAATCLAQDRPATPTAPTSSDTTVAPRTGPRVGVALEGGGALGQAHVGVLKWFDEHHIPVDYVAGTSMGGLVGGMYAIGESADEMTQILKSTDWRLVIEGRTPNQDLSFRRKEDGRQVLNSIRVGLKGGITLPAGLNSGHQVNLLIDRETLPYSGVHSFNDLPIPFRCVSTELVSGQAYVFQGGSLSEAMRATMSIPGVFAPVRRGNQVFVDGALVDNLPTDVVREMGADVVIAVHLQTSETTAGEIQSALSVLSRSVRIVVAQTELRGMENADLVVRANVEQYGTMDYEETDSLIQIGYAAAEAKAQVLKPYELNDQAWAEYQTWKKSRKRNTVGVPQFVRVEGVGVEATSDIENFLRSLIGRPIKTEDVDSYLTRLTGLGPYDSATYSMIDEGGRDGLMVRVHEKSYAPPLLQPFFQVDGAEPQDVIFTLGARITAMDVAGPRSEWRTDIEFGGTYGVQSQLYLPFSRLSKWFWEPFAGGSSTSLDIYQKRNPRAIYRLNRVLGGANVGYAFNRFNQISVGYGVGYADASLRLGQPEFSPYSGRMGAVQLIYTRDHTNGPIIPTNGYYFQSKFYWYDTSPAATEPFPSLDLYTAFFHPVSDKASVFFLARGGSTFGSQGTGTPQFFLGGPGHLSAYGLNELFGNQYFFGNVGYLHKIFTLPPFVGTQVYLYGAGEVGKMYNDPTAPRLSGDGVIGAVAETLVGPILIGGSVGDTGHRKWFFQLGRIF